jgi:hypothetical protein
MSVHYEPTHGLDLIIDQFIELKFEISNNPKDGNVGRSFELNCSIFRTNDGYAANDDDLFADAERVIIRVHPKAHHYENEIIGRIGPGLTNSKTPHIHMHPHFLVANALLDELRRKPRQGLRLAYNRNEYADGHAFRGLLEFQMVYSL